MRHLDADARKPARAASVPSQRQSALPAEDGAVLQLESRGECGCGKG